MKLIVGLGNPGAEYKASRHNAGFCVIDALSSRWSIELKKRKFDSRFGGGLFGLEQVVLLKPQTFMNLSGASVVEALSFYKMPLSDVLIISDEMSLGLGRLRLREGGSAGGHNGLKDIIARCGSGFARLRIGIGDAEEGGSVSHVLGRFCEKEHEEMAKAYNRGCLAVESWIENGMESAMNQFNCEA